MSENATSEAAACVHSRALVSYLGCVDCERDDLSARVRRTLDYADELLRLPDLNSQLADVLRAVYGSLTTPVEKAASSEVPRG